MQLPSICCAAAGGGRKKEKTEKNTIEDGWRREADRKWNGGYERMWIGVDGSEWRRWERKTSVRPRSLSLPDEKPDLYPPPSKVMAVRLERGNLSDTSATGDAQLNEVWLCR